MKKRSAKDWSADPRDGALFSHPVVKQLNCPSRRPSTPIGTRVYRPARVIRERLTRFFTRDWSSGALSDDEFERETRRRGPKQLSAGHITG